MTFAYTLDVPFDETTYHRLIDAIGVEPMPGALFHLCTRRQEGGLRYLDVWESEEAFSRSFDERIRPALEAVLGGPPARELQLLDVVRTAGAVSTTVD